MFYFTQAILTVPIYHLNPLKLFARLNSPLTAISPQEEHQKEIKSLQAIVEQLKSEQEEAKLRLDEERLEVVEAKRKIEEERQALEKELKKKEKMIQNQILGKSESNSRPRISFGMKKK